MWAVELPMHHVFHNGHNHPVKVMILRGFFQSETSRMLNDRCYDNSFDQTTVGLEVLVNEFK